MQELELLQARIRRVDLLRYREDTFPRYRAGWFHRDLALRLERFSKQVAAGLSPRLMIFAPPRHGKTHLTSEAFPAWHLGQFPHHEIIGASYSSDLALRASRRVRQLVESPLTRQSFPELELAREGVEHWETTEGGGYRAAGRGQGITGMGAHILVLDDMLKDAAEAASETIRAGLLDWYESTAYTRLMEGGGVLLIQTRWHKNDLAGALLKREADGETNEGWEVVSYKAIATEDEEHRKKGEPLDPARFPAERLQKIKQTLTVYFWSALYQQEPIEKENLPFKDEELARFLELPKRDANKLPVIYAPCATIDVAYTKKKTSDDSAWAVGVTDGENTLWVLKLTKKQLGTKGTINLCFDLLDMYEGIGLRVLHIEGNEAFFVALEQEMRLRNRYFKYERLEHEGVAKTDRIETFQASLHTVKFHATECAVGIVELTQWSRASDVDDCSDAVAYLRKVAQPAQRARRPDPHANSPAVMKEVLAEQNRQPGPNFQSKKPTRG